MHKFKDFLGILLILFIATSCKKSPELAADYIPVFTGHVKAESTITKLTLSTTFTGLNIEYAEKCGFELSKKDGTNSVEFSVTKPGSSEMVIQVDTSLRKSIEFKARAWIIVGSKKFYSSYTQFSGVGLPPPEITSLSKSYAFRGDIVYIYGKNFTDEYKNEEIVVKIGNIRCDVYNAAVDKIVVWMPVIQTKGKVNLSINVYGQDAVKEVEIENYWPEIYSVTPQSISSDGEITIKGKFHSEYSDIIFPGTEDRWSPYKIMKYTDDEIIIKPSDFMNCDSVYNINFIVDGGYLVGKFLINTGFRVQRSGIWQKLNNLPFKYDPGNANYSGLSYNGNVYIIWGNEYLQNMYFWRYNPQTDSWTKLTDFPGLGRRESVLVECNGIIYFGLGNRDYYTASLVDFWKFDPVKNVWQRCADFKSENIYDFNGFGMNIKDTISVFTDNLRYKYNQADDTWEVSPFAMPSSRYNRLFNYRGDYYLQKESDWEFYQYNPSSNSFTLQYTTYDINYYARAFTTNDRIFMLGECKVWEVDLTNKRVYVRNELSNYYSKNTYDTENIFSIDGVPYFFTRPNILCKMILGK